MRRRFIELIDQGSAALSGSEGRIVAKMNGLEDPMIVRKLYGASQAGVSIDLIVRGNCRLRPGIPASATTSACSASSAATWSTFCIFYFANNGVPLYYIGSADWMRHQSQQPRRDPIPIEDPRIQEYMWLILHGSLNDYRQAWRCCPMVATGSQPFAGSNALESGGVQNYLMQHRA